MDEFQQPNRVKDEPQPAVVDGQIPVRRNGSHFVLETRADPQRAQQFVGLGLAAPAGLAMICSQ